MVILTLLSDLHRKLVDAAAPRGATVVHANHGPQLLDAIRRAAAAHLIVDPAYLADMPFAHVVEAASTCASMFLLGRLSAGTCQAYLLASRSRPTKALFTDMGETDRLRNLLREADTVDVPGQIVTQVGNHFLRIPLHLRIQTVGLFAGTSIPRSASQLGRIVGIHHRTIERWYARAGLAGVARVLSVARLARAWPLMHAHHLSLVRIAKLVGFGSPRTLSRQCFILTQSRASRAHALAASEFATHLGQALARRETF